MQSGRLPWPIVFVIALILLCGTAGPAAADHISPDVSTFVGEFHAFLADFPRWDASHFDLPLLAWMMTPDQQRPALLFLLMDLWLLDHQNTSMGALTVPPVLSLPDVPQQGVSGPPGTGDGGGTVSSVPPGPPNDGGGPGGPSHGAPEPTSLTLAACGSLGLIAYRFVRSRAARKR